MAEKLVLYYYDSTLLSKDSKKNKVNFSIFTSEIMGEKLFDFIENI